MNKVILMGRLTRDPETRYTQTNNTLISSFMLSSKTEDLQDKVKKRQADFIKYSCME